MDVHNKESTMSSGNMYKNFSKEEVTQKTLEIVKMNLGVNEPTLKDHIFDDLKADSLDSLELIIEAEETFGIYIPEDTEKLMKKFTVGSLVDVICKILDNNGRLDK